MKTDTEWMQTWQLWDKDDYLCDLWWDPETGYHIFNEDDFYNSNGEAPEFHDSGRIQISKFWTNDPEKSCTQGDDEFNTMINGYPSNPNNLNVSDK